jgi:hypothetical protein
MINEDRHNLSRALDQAREEIKQEDFEQLVAEQKTKLRAHVPFWQRVFPFTITIRRASWLKR